MSDTPVSTVLRSPRALLFGGVFLTIVVVLVGVYLLVLRQTYAVLVAGISAVLILFYYSSAKRQAMGATA